MKIEHKRQKILSIVLAAFVIAVCLRIFVVEGFIVRGDSMAPTISPGEYVFINKLAYLFGEPNKNDLVIAVPREFNKKIIKRVVGLPGDLIEVSENQKVYIDPQEYFLLGDNWENSVDSRDLGFVDKWSIKGKVFASVNFRNFSIKSY